MVKVRSGIIWDTWFFVGLVLSGCQGLSWVSTSFLFANALGIHWEVACVPRMLHLGVLLAIALVLISEYLNVFDGNVRFVLWLSRMLLKQRGYPTC